MSITGLVDANGTAVVNYRYDSWGMLTGITGSMAGTLGKDNPYRFKGYYYDEETGMYYLKSRYYQPEICRFISADEEDVLTSTYVGFTNYFVNNRRQDRGKSRLHLECICPFLWTAHRFLPIESNRVRLSKTLWNFNVFSLP